MPAGAKAGRMHALHIDLSSTRWPSDDAAGTFPEHGDAALGRTRWRLTHRRLARLRGTCRSAHVLRHPQEARLRAASARCRPGHTQVQARKSCPSRDYYEQVHLRHNFGGGSGGDSPGSLLVAAGFDAADKRQAVAYIGESDGGASLPSTKWGNWLHCNPTHFQLGGKRAVSRRKGRSHADQTRLFYSRRRRSLVGDGKNKNRAAGMALFNRVSCVKHANKLRGRGAIFTHQQNAVLDAITLALVSK